MRKLLLALILLLGAGAGEARAYTYDRVLIMTQMLDKTQNSQALLWAAAAQVSSTLNKHYRCLELLSDLDLTDMLNLHRYQQLLGTAGEQERLDALGDRFSNSKYIVKIKVSDSILGIGFDISAWNRKSKKPFPFYGEQFRYASAEAALAALPGIAEAFAKDFGKNSSEEQGGSEVCPYQGPVTVTVTEQSEVKEGPETFIKYCNGQDQSGERFSSRKVDRKKVWKLERIGRPDTKGTFELNAVEVVQRREMDGCHVCSSGRQGGRSYEYETRAVFEATGLSDQSKGESQNLDASIYLHFNENGTYTVTVKAASMKGTVRSTLKESAVGTCDNLNRSQKTDSTFTTSFEYTFGPYAGTVFDNRHARKDTLSFTDPRTEEETTIEIDYTLERPRF